MITLYEKYKNEDSIDNNIGRINPEDIVDSLYCLCNSVENGEFIQASPENIVINENGTVLLLNDPNFNLYYVAPEVIMGKKKADKMSAWFTLGVLCYFLINGRSFYNDKSINVVTMKEMGNIGSGLITAEGIDQLAEDVPSLLSLAMEKFTSWDPLKRSEGVKYVLKAVKQYTSVAVFNYEDNDQIVKSDRFAVEGSSLSCEEGASITDEDGNVYSVLKTETVPFRPGVRTYTIRVKKAETDAPNELFEKYLCVQIAPETKKYRLMKLEALCDSTKIEVDRSADRRYVFYVLTGDPIRRKTISDEYKYYVNIPAAPLGGTSLLQVSYNPDTGFDVALYNRAGTVQISDNVMHFDM